MNYDDSLHGLSSLLAHINAARCGMIIGTENTFGAMDEHQKKLC
jgi:hypothetical protein